MDRAAKISGSLTTSIQNIFKEPTINTGWHGQALEKPAKIFDNATYNLETQQQNRAQTLSTPTTRTNIRATPRVHACVMRNNTPGITPQQPPTTIVNTEDVKEYFPPISNSEGGQNSERKINKQMKGK